MKSRLNIADSSSMTPLLGLLAQGPGVVTPLLSFSFELDGKL